MHLHICIHVAFAGIVVYAVDDSVAGEDEREEMVCWQVVAGPWGRTSQHEVAMRSLQAPIELDSPTGPDT